MRLMKKIMVIACTATMAMGLLAGCGKENKTTQTNKGETQVKQEETGETAKNDDSNGVKEVTKPESIHWMVHSGMVKENGTDEWVAEFEKKTGIDMNLEIVSNNEYSTILELAFASGKVPQVFDLAGDNIAVYANQNAIADLTELVKASDFYDKVDPAIWDAVSLDGKIYGIPGEIPSGAVTYVRKDWLDRLGMEIPTNYEEFIAMLTAFKNEIPECTVPFTAPGLKTSMNLAEFFLGANPDFNKVDGKWVDGMSQDNMVSALERLSEGYANGLIDIEVVTNTTSNCRDQWYSGSVGVFSYWGGNWGQTLTERLQVNVPEAEVVAINPIEGAVYEFAVPTLYCISSDLSEDEIASVFEYFIDYMHDGGEGQLLFESGVEGVHWKQDGNNMVQLPTLSIPEEIFKKAWITPWLAISPLELTDKNFEMAASVTDSLAVINEFGVQKSVYPVSETLTKNKASITMLKEEIIAKVVMGDLTVEEGINRYKSEIAMLDIDKVISELNAH